MAAARDDHSVIHPRESKGRVSDINVGEEESPMFAVVQLDRQQLPSVRQPRPSKRN